MVSNMGQTGDMDDGGVEEGYEWSVRYECVWGRDYGCGWDIWMGVGDVKMF